MVKDGDKISNFSLDDGNGKKISLSDFSGKKVVVYFYPKDNTPGCTTEACGFRDNFAAITAKGAVVIGISADSVKSHSNFAQKYELPFYLLSDPDKQAINLFGAWGEKKLYGKAYDGIIRSTFILDEDGVVLKAFPKVTVKGHVEEVMSFLDSIQ